MKQFQSLWRWPLTVLVSVLLVIFFTFLYPGTPVQGVTILWFAILCPGMSLVPLLRLNHFFIEVTLAVALSFSIGAIVVGVFLYAGYWSPPAMLWVLIVVSLVGSLLQVLLMSHAAEGGA